MGQTKGNFFSGAEILIAEDSQTQAEQLSHYLSTRGFAVTVARDGRQALAAAHHSKPAMIITDVVMPEMDGYTLCKEIKSLEALKDVPVVLLTSLSGPQDIVRGLECGADSFIRKPYDDKYLVSRVEYILTNVELRKTETIAGRRTTSLWRPIAFHYRRKTTDSGFADLDLRRCGPNQRRTGD